MARTKSQRRKALDMIKGIREIATQLRENWTVSAAVAEHPQDEDGRTGNAVWRKRSPEEYPENSPAAWQKLYREADEMIEQAYKLRAFAHAQWLATGNPRNWAPCGCHRILFNGRPAIEHGLDCLEPGRGRVEMTD